MSDPVRFREGDVVRAKRRMKPIETIVFGGDPVSLEKGDLLEAVTVMEESGLFDAVTFTLVQGQPSQVFVALFCNDFEHVSALEVLALAALGSEDRPDL